MASNRLSSNQKASLIYHSIFSFPLTKKELHTWSTSKKSLNSFPGGGSVKIKTFNGFYYINGKKNDIAKRFQNEEISKQKLKIAKKAGEWLTSIPTVKFVGVTGSLAMRNASRGSDIDLMVITSRGALWTTRLLVYLLFKFSNLTLRKPNQKEIPDALCLNIWLDVSDFKAPP